jgi:uncharacterized protein YrrD
MRKISELLKKPLMASGQKVGTVKDVIMDEKAEKLLGFLVKDSKKPAEAQVVPFASISSIGTDALLLQPGKTVVPASSDPTIIQALATHISLKGKKILDEKGTELGKILDALFDEKSGKISWYETDKKQGQDPLVAEAGKIIQPGSDSMIVSADIKSEPEKQAMSEGSASMPPQSQGDLLQQAKTQGQTLGSPVINSIKDKAAEVKEKVSASMAASKEQDALGRTVTKVVLGPKDEPIISPGQIITHQILEQAKSLGVGDILIQAVAK